MSAGIVIRSILVYLFGILLIRDITSRLFGRKILERILSFENIRQYPNGIIIGSSIILILIVVVFVYYIFGRSSYSSMDFSSVRLPYTSRLNINIDNIDLTSKQLTGQVAASDVFGILAGDANVHNGSTLPVIIPFSGDTYLYPFSSYKVNLYASGLTVAGNQLEVFSEQSRLRIIIHEDLSMFDLDGSFYQFKIVFGTYQKLLVIIVFIALAILMISLWATSDRSTVIELAVGILVALLSIRSFLIPAQVPQPLLIDQVILAYIIILMMTILIKLSKRNISVN
jgi:hypothetical protein